MKSDEKYICETSAGRVRGSHIVCLPCILGYFIVLTAVCALSLIVLLDDTYAKPGHARLSLLMATGATGDTSNILGEAMASLWSERLAGVGISVSAATSEGAGENIEALRISDADLIIADTPLCESAAKGVGVYRGRRVWDMRAMAPLWNEALHIVIRSDLVKSQNLKDLEGLKIGTGLPESSGRLMFERVMRFSRATGARKIKLISMSNRAATGALLAGEVQGIALMGSAPIPVITALRADEEIDTEFIGLNDEDMAGISSEDAKGMLRVVIPPGVYRGMRGPIKTLGVQKLLAVSSELDEQVVYALTKSLYQGLNRLVKAHPAAREIQPLEGLQGLSIPLHKGAYRYYMEKGIPAPTSAAPISGEGPVSPIRSEP